MSNDITLTETETTILHMLRNGKWLSIAHFRNRLPNWGETHDAIMSLQRKGMIKVSQAGYPMAYIPND
jgi:hypothetical protein